MQKQKFDQIISLATNNLLGKYYADFISWATWNPNDINDLSMFIDPAVINMLKTDHVILGFNAAAINSNSEALPPACGGFHCRHQGGRDHWLMQATKGTPFEYAYMSDTLKISETNSAKVKIAYKDVNVKQTQLKLLVDELSLLGDSLKIIVIGDDAEVVLNDAIKGGYLKVKVEYAKVPHYAKPGITTDEFMNAFKSAIDKLENIG